MWWLVLGCEQTDDEKTVKKAYGQLIRTVDQDKEIDRFTKIHQAYRLAMKDFKSRSKLTEPAEPQTYEVDVELYLAELNKLYNDPYKRLDEGSWKTLFACMSFLEEHHFIGEYVRFFNSHFYLTDTIWSLIEDNYPLSGKDTFVRQDLLNGNLKVCAEDYEGMDDQQRVSLVESKIDIYYMMLDQSYEAAAMLADEYLSLHQDSDVLRWALVLAVIDDRETDAKRAYDALVGMDSYMAAYEYGGYLCRKGHHQKSIEVLEQLAPEQRDQSVKKLLGENQFKLRDEATGNIRSLPWIELQAATKRDQKLMGKGLYQKAFKDSESTGVFKSLFGGKG